MCNLTCVFYLPIFLLHTHVVHVVWYQTWIVNKVLPYVVVVDGFDSEESWNRVVLLSYIILWDVLL